MLELGPDRVKSPVHGPSISNSTADYSARNAGQFGPFLKRKAHTVFLKNQRLDGLSHHRTNRSEECVSVAPSGRQPLMQNPRLYPNGLSPFSHRSSLSVVLKPHVSTFISSLLDGRSPAAILRRVRPVVIDAINRVLRGWRVAHIGQEVRERTSPSFTDGNASSAVLSIPFVVGILASLPHRVPNPVSLGLAHPMRWLRTGTGPTPSSVTIGQVVSSDRSFGAAVAPAQQVSVPFFLENEPATIPCFHLHILSARGL